MRNDELLGSFFLRDKSLGMTDSCQRSTSAIHFHVASSAQTSQWPQQVCLDEKGQVTPDDHPDKSLRLSNSFLHRFDRLGDHSDINKSVSPIAKEEVIQLLMTILTSDKFSLLIAIHFRIALSASGISTTSESTSPSL